MNSNEFHGRYFLYRSEHLSWRLTATASTERTVVETGRRKWRISEGDNLLFTEGGGLELRFVALASVLNVKSEQVEADDMLLTTVTVVVAPPTLLPEGLFLSRFMYSLITVSNFGRPWLHMRHKSRVSSVDVKTLAQERISWDRTVFFGLLRELPGRWREVLEAESRARRAAGHVRETIQRWTPPETEPVKELLGLLEDTVVSPTRLAAELLAQWSATLGRDTLTSTEVVGPEQSDESWRLPQLLEIAARKTETIDTNWTTVSDLPFAEPLRGEEFNWRPHRW